MSQICILKLINGDEIIGEREPIDGPFVRVGNPLVVEEVMNLDGSHNVVLTSYVPFSKEHHFLDFKQEHVIQVLNVVPEAERFYHNSVIYNQKYLARLMEERLRATNESMEASMVATEEEEPKKKSRRQHRVISKSIH